MLYLASAFDFDPARFSLAEAERHYRDYHGPLARRLPGLRRYAVGPLVATRAIPVDRARDAILASDNLDALRAARRGDRAARRSRRHRAMRAAAPGDARYSFSISAQLGRGQTGSTFRFRSSGQTVRQFSPNSWAMTILA